MLPHAKIPGLFQQIQSAVNLARIKSVPFRSLDIGLHVVADMQAPLLSCDTSQFFKQLLPLTCLIFTGIQNISILPDAALIQHFFQLPPAVIGIRNNVNLFTAADNFRQQSGHFPSRYKQFIIYRPLKIRQLLRRNIIYSLSFLQHKPVDFLQSRRGIL